MSADDYQQLKEKWDAEAAKIAAQKAAREEAEASTPAAVARRELLAENDVSAAQREQLTALIPDLSKVTRGGLTVSSGGQPTAGTGVAGEAFRDAAERVKNDVVAKMGADTWTVLVTSDTDLAASDATYQDVKSGLELLTSLATDVMKSTEDAAEVEGTAEHVLPVMPVLAIGAVAQALPGLLSLLSPPRTVTTGTVDFDDIAASAAVAGALKEGNAGCKVFHDSVRLAPIGDLSSAVSALDKCRHELVKRQTALEAREPAPGGAIPTSDLVEAIALVTKTIASIDAYLTSLHAVPAGAVCSPLAEAALREGLHGAQRTFDCVLFVKASSASGLQMVQENLIRHDKVAVLAAASITWMLLSTETGEVLDARVTTGTAHATGTIGEDFQLGVKKDVERPDKFERAVELGGPEGGIAQMP